MSAWLPARTSNLKPMKVFFAAGRYASSSETTTFMSAWSAGRWSHLLRLVTWQSSLSSGQKTLRTRLPWNTGVELLTGEKTWILKGISYSGARSFSTFLFQPATYTCTNLLKVSTPFR